MRNFKHLQKNETNPYYIQLLKVKMDKYFGKKNVTNVKECLKEGTVYGPLCAYRLFYVGCSRAKRNLVIMINKKDIEGFEDKLRNKLMITDTKTSTNTTSGKKEVTHTIQLSNLEEAVRQAGKNYKEWR